MKLYRGFLIVAAVLGLGVERTAGQVITSPYRFIDTSQSASVFGGYVFSGTGPVELGPKPGPAGGVRYKIRLSGPFDIEADAIYFATSRAVRDTAFTEDSTRLQLGEADMAVAAFTAALRFNLTGARTWHRVQPFVVFGGGAALDFAGDQVEDELVAPDVRFKFGTSFAGTLGGGVEWFATDRLSMRLEARSMLWKLKTPTPFLFGDAALTTPAEEWTQNGFLSLGFAFHF